MYYELKYSKGHRWRTNIVFSLISIIIDWLAHILFMFVSYICNVIAVLFKVFFIYFYYLRTTHMRTSVKTILYP